MVSTNNGPGRWLAIFRSPEWGLGASILAILGLIYLLDPTRSFFLPRSQDSRSSTRSASTASWRSGPPW